VDKLFENAVFMRHALDAIPSMVLVTDDDVRIRYRNRGARELLKGERIYGSRAGEIMHCIHAEDVPGGCGRGPHCEDCLVRNSVTESFSGKSVHRRPADITVKTGGRTLEIAALVSVSPLSYEGKIYALLVIEDISELAELRSLLPICSSCKRIRAENGSWEKIEAYIKRTAPEVKFSHGLCPACAKRLYPKYSD
jgi:PAS domain-containing protein